MSDKNRLQGRTVLLTGTAATNERAATQVDLLGGCPVKLPLIRTAVELPDISEESSYDWLLFTSAAAVKHYFEHIGSRIRFKNIAAVGPATALALTDNGHQAGLMPEKQFNAAGLAEALLQLPQAESLTFLFPCSKEAAQTLNLNLTDRGLNCRRLPFYGPELLPPLPLPLFDSIIFFSPSAVRAFETLYGSSMLQHKTLVAIGPTTADAIVGELKIQPLTARTYSAAGAVLALTQP